MFLNTRERATVDRKPVQTTFHFDPSKHDECAWNDGLGAVGLVFDLGGDEASCADNLFAPFYPDASQRLLVAESSDHSLLVMKTETLLRLAQERKNRDLRWGEWEDHATWVTCEAHNLSLWVSGTRLCCVRSTDSGKLWMDVYDFSARASAKYTKTVRGGIIQQPAPSASRSLPWNIRDTIIADGCHNGIVFLVVKVPHS